jgi:nucleotide-binding universal stress UspA family protein
MYTKILVPLDGSERAERILPHVEVLARQMGSTLLILQVVEPIYDVIDPQGTIVALAGDLMDQLEQEATGYVNRLAGEFKEGGLKVETYVERGPVVNTITLVADREGVDLVAMASHGRTGLARVFYGSVAAGVLHRIDRPLLLIRADG